MGSSKEIDNLSVIEYIKEKGRAAKAKSDLSINNKTLLELGKEQLFLENLKKVLETGLKNKIEVKHSFSPKSKGTINRALNLLLSDLHYGANLKSKDCPLDYGAVEEARRTASICRQVADYKPQYRKQTELNINLMGDIIQNQLHDPRDGEPLAHQAASAIYLLSQSVAYLSTQFPKVKVRCTPGNHGRFKSRHPQRATNEKWDSLENVIYFAIKMACAKLPNVTVEVPYSPFYSYTVFDKKIFITHGDTVLTNTGIPSNSINIANIRKQVNEINAKQSKNEHYNLFCIGHVHVGSLVHLPNGAIFMSNGCLIPPDGFSTSIGVLHSACGQYLFESTKGHVVGDSRFIQVDEYTDKDQSLDSIIKPFISF